MSFSAKILAAGLLAGAVTLAIAGCSSGAQNTHETSIGWTEYQISGPNEITVTAVTGDEKCFSLREEHEEKDGVLTVNIYEKERPDAPKECKAIANYQDFVITTKAPAEQLRVDGNIVNDD